MLTQLKRFIPILCSLTILAGVCLPGLLHAADLKIATVAPEGSSWMKDLRAAGLQIRERTSGRLNLKFYGGGIQGSDRKVLRKIRIGQLHGGVFTSNGLQERYPDIVIYGSPMLFDTIDEVDFVRKRMDKRLAAGLEKAGFVSFGFAGGGFAYLMSNKPVKGIADLRGQKIWVPEGDPTSYAAMESLELSPVALPITDVLTGLQTGLFESFLAPPQVALITRYYEQTKYMTDMKVQILMGATVIKKDTWEKIPADLRPKLMASARTAGDRLQRAIRDSYQRDVDAMKKAGLVVVPVDARTREMWRRSVEVGYPIIRGGVMPADAFDDALRYRDEYRRQKGAAKK